MQILDPDAIELRKKGRLKRRLYFAKGPNYLWHVDSYEKLKPFGFCINGCIDGFSRYMIWLNVYHTRVNASYYVEAIGELAGRPQLVRGNMGTENGHLARMQTFLSGHREFPIWSKHAQPQNRKLLVRLEKGVCSILGECHESLERQRRFHR